MRQSEGRGHNDFPSRFAKKPKGRSFLLELRLMNLEYAARSSDRILVTGSNGFIGAKVVENLLEYGFTNLRCFVRPSSRLGHLREVLSRFSVGKNVDVFTGDLLSSDDCRRAADGVSVIYHLAAGIEK